MLVKSACSNGCVTWRIKKYKANTETVKMNVLRRLVRTSRRKRERNEIEK